MNKKLILLFSLSLVLSFVGVYFYFKTDSREVELQSYPVIGNRVCDTLIPPYKECYSSKYRCEQVGNAGGQKGHGDDNRNSLGWTCQNKVKTECDGDTWTWSYCIVSTPTPSSTPTSTNVASTCDTLIPPYKECYSSEYRCEQIGTEGGQKGHGDDTRNSLGWSCQNRVKSECDGDTWTWSYCPNPISSGSPLPSASPINSNLLCEYNFNIGDVVPSPSPSPVVTSTPTSSPTALPIPSITPSPTPTPTPTSSTFIATCSQKLAYKDVSGNNAGSYNFDDSNKLSDSSELRPGDRFVYRVKGNDLSTDPAGDIIWTDTLDSDLEYVDGDSCVSYNSSTRVITCNKGVTRSYSFSFRVKIKDSTSNKTLTNKAYVKTNGSSENSCENSILVRKVDAPAKPELPKAGQLPPTLLFTIGGIVLVILGLLF